ncbi:MAG: ABC transporter substrate-binding protein, partial [Psychromonas sp.]
IGAGKVANYNPYTVKDLIAGTIYEPLFIHNGKTGEIEPRVAESIDVSDDLMTITVKVRPNLKWSDGKPLTAEDVAYSYALTKEAKAFDVRGMWGEEGSLESVTATDATTVVFKMSKADSTFLWGLKDYYIVPKHIWGEVDNLTTFTNPNPVGNGPMTEVEFMSAQQLKLCRNPHYWQADKGRPYLDCIVARSFNDNSQIQAALMKGEIDWASNFVADIDKTYVSRNPETNKYWYPANDAIFLYVNHKKAPFDNLEVRKALSMSLDREMIVDIAAYGYPTANYSLTGLGDYFESYIDKDIDKKNASITAYNPDNAMKILDAEGYKDLNGDGFRQLPNGDPISFEIEVVAGWTDWIQTVQMVTEYFAEVGIEAKIKTVDWAVYDKNLKDGSYDVSINWSATNNAHPIEAYHAFYSESSVGKSWQAGHGFINKDISDLIVKFGTISDLDEQNKIITELQDYTASNVPFIPLFSNATWFQYNTTEIVGWPDADNPYIHPNYYQADKKVKILDHLHLK